MINKRRMIENWTMLAVFAGMAWALSTETPTQHITVEAVAAHGDTAWEIVEDTAARYGDDRTMQEVMAGVYRANNNLGNIKKGDIIIIPLEVKKSGVEIDD